jgi:hypothetical protein
MIRRFSIRVTDYVRNELPAHLRGGSSLLAFFRALLAPLGAIADEWKAWRETSITRARVTAETKSLEWYLNEKFPNTGDQIYIETAGLSGVSAGIAATEPTKYFVAGIESSEPAKYTVIGLKGEDTGFVGVSFIVFVPAVLAGSVNAIAATVQEYRYAGKKFSVKTF